MKDEAGWSPELIGVCVCVCVSMDGTDTESILSCDAGRYYEWVLLFRTVVYGLNGLQPLFISSILILQ